MLSINDGILLVKSARKSVIDHLNGHTSQDLKSKFSFKSGVFVTINDSVGLRGCIGYPLPEKELHIALKDASISAATNDFRFAPLKLNELNEVTFEVTILTPPEEILVENPDEYISKIKIGRDGLIITKSTHSGLLLPQVPLEYNWDEKEFLERTCQKADLEKDCWRDNAKIQKFQAIIFKEEHPNGNIIQVKL